MFYRPGKTDHGLPHNPFKALITPRPIGWISSIDREGRVNLAPYSFFNAIADAPPLIMYSNTGTKRDGSVKDSLTNIRETGEFVHHVVSRAMTDAMSASSGEFPAGEDEFEKTGLEKAASEIVAPPRIKTAPAALECRVWKIIDLPGEHNHMVIGEVVGIHIDESILVNGMVDPLTYEPMARLGYRDYSAVQSRFTLNRPGQKAS